MLSITDLKQTLGLWTRRLRLQRALTWALRGCIIGLGLSLILGSLGLYQARLLPEEFLALILSLSLLTPLLFGLTAYFWRIQPLKAARRFDLLFQLEERVSTALELNQHPEHVPPEILSLQLSDAVTASRNVNPSRALPLELRAREALLAVTIPELPGAFREFCAAIGRRVVTEFNYRLSGRAQAHIFVGVATESRHDGAALAARLNASGYETVDLTENETAKLHVRHMVGGHAPEVRHERLCRFEFPERPGALLEFLQAIGSRWNISLFHYRNHGSDYGRVLAGVQVPAADMPDFRAHLAELGYPWWDESANPAYRMFLGVSETVSELFSAPETRRQVHRKEK